MRPSATGAPRGGRGVPGADVAGAEAMDLAVAANLHPAGKDHADHVLAPGSTS